MNLKLEKPQAQNKRPSSNSEYEDWVQALREQSRQFYAPAYAKQLSEQANALFKGLTSLGKAYNERMSDDRKTFVPGTDATAWNGQLAHHLSTFEHGRDLLIGKLEQCRPYLGDEYVDNFLQQLNSGNDAVAAMREGGKAYLDFWNSFNPSEAQLAVGETAESLHKQWADDQTYMPVYKGKSVDELTQILGKLEEGEERTWLESYIASVKYQETINMDIGAAQERLDYLRENRTAWSNEYSNLKNERDIIVKYDNDGFLAPPERLGEIEARMQSILDEAGVADIGDIPEVIAKLEEDINAAQRNQDLVQAEEVADPTSERYDPEFEQLSLYIQQNRTREYSNDFDPWLYENDPSYQDWWQNRIDLMPNEGKGYEIKSQQKMQEKWDNLITSEKATYTYYRNKYGKEKADEYFGLLDKRLAARCAYDIKQEYSGSFGGEMYIQFQSAMDKIGQDFDSFGGMVTGNEKYKPTSAWTIAGQESMERLADYGGESLFGRSWGQVAGTVVNAGTYMAPSLLAATAVGLISKSAGATMAYKTFSQIAGATVMGMQSAGGSYQDMINSGHSKEAAATYGTLVGLSEAGLSYLLSGIGKAGGALTEKILGTTISKLDNVFLAGAVKLGANLASEGLEEYIQYGLEGWFKNIALGTNYRVDMLSDDALYEGFIGAITSLFMEGPGIVTDVASSYVKGKQLTNAGVTGAQLAEIGKTMSVDIQKLTSRLNENSSPYAIGNAFREIGAVLSEENVNRLVKGLQTRGLTKKDATVLANTINGIAMGRALSEQQIEMLNANEGISKVFVEMMRNPDAYTEVAEVMDRTQAFAEIAAAPEVARAARKQQKAAEKQQTAATVPAETQQNATASPEASGVTQDIGEANAVSESAESLEEVDFETSTEGKTVYKGEEVSIQGVAAVKSGKLMLRLSNGQVADASEISYGSESEALIYQTVARMNISPKAAGILVNSYLKRDSALSAEEYAKGIEEAYRYGQQNIDESKLKDSTYASKLNPGEQGFVYRQGQKVAGKQTAKDQARVDAAYQQAKKALGQKRDENTDAKAHTVRLADGLSRESMDESQGASYDLAEKIAPAVKGDILIYEGKKEWGYYDADADTVCLNINAQWSKKSMMAFTLAHELVHRAKAGSPAKFKAFANFLMKEYGKQGSNVDAMIAEQLNAAKEAGIKMTEEEAYEEIVCDACQRMLLDTDAGRKLAEFGAQSEQNKSFVKKLGKWLKKLLNKLRGIFRNVEPDSLAAKEFQKFDAAAKQILADMFVDMSIDAGEKLSTIHEAGMGKKITASEGGVKSKIGAMSQEDIRAVQNIGRKSINQFSSADIKVTERFAQQYLQEMGVKTPFFRAWFGDWRINDQTPVQVATQRGDTRVDHTNKDTGWVIRNSGKVHDETKNHKSAKNREAVPYLPYIDAIIENAILLDTWGQGKNKSENSLLMHYLYAVADIGHGPEVLKLHVEEMYNPGKQDSGKRAYSLQNIEKAFIVRGRVQGNAPSSGTNTTNAIRTVADLFAAVKSMDAVFQPKPTSKVVNADGTPKVMYHGSPAQFTIFDKKKAKSSGQYGRGFYFTDSQSHAGQYGQQYSVYLNIKNPLEYGKGTVSRAQVRKFLEAVAENEDYSIENYGTYDVDSVLQTIMGKNGSMDAFQLIQDINATAIGDMVEAAELFNKVNGTSFDGIVTATETVAFRPEQIKSATDNIGTFDGSNPDIRYKVPVDAKSPTYEELVAKEPIAVVDVGRNVDGLSYADLKKQVLQNAEARKLFDVPHLNSDTEISIFLTPASFTHAFSNLTADFGIDTILAMDHIDEIIHEAVLTHIAAPKNPRKAESRVFTFFAAIDGENGTEPIKLKVKEYRGQNIAEFPQNIRAYFAQNGVEDTHNRLYDAVALEVVAIENAKKESGASASVASQKRLGAKGTPNSTIKIAELLQLVNGDARKYIPEANGDKPLKLPVGEDTSPRTLLANALEGVTQNEIEERKLREYREQIGHMEEQERKLQELNAEIRKLSFAPGPRDTARIEKLREEAAKTANRISTYDRRLLKLEAAKPLQRVLERERKKAYQKADQKNRDAMKAYKQTVDQRFADMKAEYREKRKAAVSEVRESAAKRDARAKLQKLVLKTAKWLAHPARDEAKCPDFLKKPYGALIEAINLDSKRLHSGGDPTQNDQKIAGAMERLANALSRIQDGQQLGDDAEAVFDAGYLDLPKNFISDLKAMAEGTWKKLDGAAGSYDVETMTAEQIRALSKMIWQLNHAIKEMTNLFSIARFANAVELGKDSVGFMEGLGELDSTSGLADFSYWQNAVPYYAFKRFGEGGKAVFSALMDAQDKLAFLAQDVFAFQDQTWTAEEADSWSKDVHEVELTDGKKLTGTTADFMSLYCLIRRDQGVKHLLGGGVRILGHKKGSKEAKDSRSLLTPEDLDILQQSLEGRPREVAEAIQEFMSTECANWGNEITMKRFMTREFVEQLYFPIESDSENLRASAPEVSKGDLFRLLNISATKPLNENANNAVIVRNIFDVFAAHASDMARLNAYALPLLDMMKWLNYQERTVTEEGQVITRGTVKAMNAAFKSGAYRYVMNLIKDINGRPLDSGMPGFVSAMFKNAKVASVAANLRVVALQFTSYPRAAAVLSNKSLSLGLLKKPQIRKAMKYSGIVLWKSFGFYDANISRTIDERFKGTKNVQQTAVELSLKGAEWADAITLGFLWNACEAEVKKTTENANGSEEFNREVALKLREVIYSTQVVDSILTRSELMRGKDGKVKEVTAFMSEPTMTYNLLLDAYSDYNVTYRQTGDRKAAWKKHGKTFARVAGVYFTSGLLSALVGSLFDAARDEDDEEYWKKLLEAFAENAIMELIPLNKIPILTDISEAALSLFGIGFFSTDNMYSTPISKIVSAIKAWESVIDGSGSATLYNAIYKTAQAVSSATGIPAGNAMRDLVALWNNTFGAVDKTLKIRTSERSKQEVADQLYDAIVSGNAQMEAKWRKVMAEKSGSADQEEVEAYIDSALKTALRDNDPRITQMAEAFLAGDYDGVMDVYEEIFEEGHFSHEIIKGAYESMIGQLDKDRTEEDVSYRGGDGTMFHADAFCDAILRNDREAAEAVRENMLESMDEKEFAAKVRTAVRDLYDAGSINSNKAVSMMISHCGMEKEEAMAKVEYWEYKQEHPDAEVDDSWFDSYYTKVVDSGISVDDYVAYRKDRKGLEKKADILKAIDSQNLSDAQKDALYFAEGYAKSELYKTPWH